MRCAQEILRVLVLVGLVGACGEEGSGTEGETTEPHGETSTMGGGI